LAVCVYAPVSEPTRAVVGASRCLLPRGRLATNRYLRGQDRGAGVVRPVLRDPRVDALPPVVEPPLLSRMVSGPGHVGGRYPPPPRVDRLVHLQVPPDVADGDDPVQPGVGDE